jgi:hypothetical protein
MSGKNTAVFGLYPDDTEPVEAIRAIERAGFRPADLSILLPVCVGSKRHSFCWKYQIPATSLLRS